MIRPDLAPGLPDLPPDLPDAWQIDDEPFPALTFLAAAAAISALVGVAFVIASPLILIRKLKP